jgi:hypothetical protein
LLPNFDTEALVETDVLDFKAQFDPASRQDWCELIKDIVAMANSGGGAIIVGVQDDGVPSGTDVSLLLGLDPADVINQIHKYTEHQFAEFQIREGTREGQRVVGLLIGGVRIPIVFVAPGTYPVAGGGQKVAFVKGTVYFRHGPKSEPGTTDDLRAALERELERVKGFWLDGIAKVVAAPPDATVQVVQHDVSLRDSPEAAPIRLTSAEGAPVFRAIQADELYPHRQKELLKALADRLGARVVGPHDLLCVRRVHEVDDNPTFCHKAHWSPRQYSDAFLEWLVEQYQSDSDFFHKARDRYRHHDEVSVAF